jgi:hypothetical protein
VSHSHTCSLPSLVLCANICCVVHLHLHREPTCSSIASAYTFGSYDICTCNLALALHCRRTRDLYLHGLREMPLLVAQMAPRARVPATVYIPPPLQANGFLWHPEHNKPWEFCGLPAYSI